MVWYDVVTMLFMLSSTALFVVGGGYGLGHWVTWYILSMIRVMQALASFPFLLFGVLPRAVLTGTRETGYDDEWYARVADDGDNAEHYATKRPAKRTEAREEEAREARRLETHKRLRMNKRRRRSEIGGDERTEEGGSVQTSR